MSELSKNKSDDQTDDEIQIVESENPVIDLCDSETRDIANSIQFQLPDDSDFSISHGKKHFFALKIILFFFILFYCHI